MKKTIHLPKPFQPLFGNKISTLDLTLILTFAIASTLMLFICLDDYFLQLKPYQSIILLMFMFDMGGGVMSNFSYTTNEYYYKHSKLRLLFISIHIQPFLMALVLDNYYIECGYVWLYTIISTFIVNYFANNNSQKIIGAFFMSFGIILVVLLSKNIPTYLFILLLFFTIKLTYSFAINHYKAIDK